MIKRIILKLGKLGKRIRPVHFFSLQDLFNRLMFFFPVLMKNNCADYQSEDNHSEKSETDFIHKFYSPLSRKIPSTIKRITILQPVIYDPIGTLFGEAILPTTITAKTIWLKLNRTFAKFSLCFWVNLINKILSKAKISVKQAKVIPPTSRGSKRDFSEKIK
ncbi:MAG: hypothetical protein ABIJ15_06335 [bacterium]